MNEPRTLAEARSYVERRRALTDEFKVTLIDSLQLDLEPREIGLDTPLFGSGLGLDSVDALAIAAAIEQKFEVTVRDTDIGQFRSINSVVDFILEGQDAGERADDEAPEPIEVTYDAPPEDSYVRVRNDLGLFDFSTTEKVEINGPAALEFLDYELTGNIADLAIGEICESAMLEDDGTIYALVWVLRRARGWWLLAHENQPRRLCGALEARRDGKDVTITDITMDYGLLALIGPRAQEAILDQFDVEILRVAYCEFVDREFRGTEITIARYGDTGEFDYRLLVPSSATESIRDDVLAAASIETIDPTIYEVLAMEMKSMRAGMLPDPPGFPTQVDLHWMLHFRKGQFRGRDGVEASMSQSLVRATLLEFEDGEGVAAGSDVVLENEVVGSVRVAAHSPRLGRGIALCFIDDAFAFPGICFSVGESATGESATTAISRAAPLFLTKTVLDNLNM